MGIALIVMYVAETATRIAAFLIFRWIFRGIQLNFDEDEWGVINDDHVNDTDEIRE